MTLKLKYGMRLAGKLYPKGTIVTPVGIEEVTNRWPNIKSHPHSNVIAVRLPDRDVFTLMSADEVDKYEHE